jgi:hypothetical protein
METRTIAPAEYFKDVKDPRIERKKLYPLTPNSAQVRLSIFSFPNSFLTLWGISPQFHLPCILI